MQPVKMTRAEYEAKYGIKPVISTSTLDTTPAPVRMTRAEYEQTYGVKPFQSTQPQSKGVFGDIPSDIAETAKNFVGAARQGAQNIQQAFTQPGLTAPQRVTGALVAAPSAVANMAGEAVIGAGKLLTTDEFEKAVSEKVGQAGQFAANTGVGKALVDFYNQLPEDDKYTLSNIIAPVANVATAVPVTKGAGAVVEKAVETVPDVATSLKKTAESFSIRGDEKALQSVVDEIAKVENKYKTIRKTNEFAKDVEGSRTRIAQSGVLEKAVDDSGKIDGKLAANLYKKQTIDGTEGIVRNLLEEEKATMKIEDIKEALELDLMKSRLEGKDLIKALDDIEGELKGFRLRADANGNIPLTKVHDFKISAADAVNWLSPTNEKIYRRTLANAYKTMIEKNSKIEMDVDGKKVGVKEINSRLGVYLEDARRLKALDGAIVDRGKLGKYQASLIGTGIGMAGGSMGGGLGAAAGGFIGGELASRMQGRAFQKTFQKGVKASVPEDKVLKAAKLRVPDKTVKAPEGLPKTEKAKDLEKAIAQNIEKQKAAIKANDFTLVARLKEIYQSLVEKLKEEVRFIRANIKDQSGFAKVPFVKGNQSTPRNFIQSKAINPPNSANSISKTVTPDVKDVKADVEDSIILENLMRLDPIDTDPADTYRFIELQRKADKAPLSESEILEAKAIIENVEGKLPKAE